MSLLLWSIPAHARFFDVAEDHPYGEAIDYLTREGIVSGYENRSFQPERYINRAEFTKIVTAIVFPDAYIDSCLDELDAAESDVIPDLDFPDVPHDQWFAAPICAAWVNGIVSGYPNGMFHPEEGVNFVEAAKMLSLAFGLTGMELPDLGRQNINWYTPYVEFLALENAIPLSIDALDQPVNRGEMAEMIYRLSGYPVLDSPAPLRLSKTTESVQYPVEWQHYKNTDYGFIFSYPNVWPEPSAYPQGYFDGRNPYYEPEWTVFFGPHDSGPTCVGNQICPYRAMWIDGYSVEDSSVILANIEKDEEFMAVEAEDVIHGTPSLIVLEEVDDCIDKRSFHFGRQWIYSISMKCGGQDEKLYQFFEELVQTFEEVGIKPPEHTK